MQAETASWEQMKVVAPSLTAKLPLSAANPVRWSRGQREKFATGISDFATLVRKSYNGAPSPIDYSDLAKQGSARPSALRRLGLP